GGDGETVPRRLPGGRRPGAGRGRAGGEGGRPPVEGGGAQGQRGEGAEGGRGRAQENRAGKGLREPGAAGGPSARGTPPHAGPPRPVAAAAPGRYAGQERYGNPCPKFPRRRFGLVSDGWCMSRIDGGNESPAREARRAAADVAATAAKI